ncbi:hypothetical protein [Aquimarina sp. 2201CG5-10]|uniref:hypothetical protein n=1 Tax=Aquimarina callyspongiae TaxID=3098150 RepID=UPI002AB38BB8|nr:hypothetical protein [Aquimarina sp. 2201CG5-10]MDY8135244.1 hypothetical protein [Aquimarina sp. 2201CG5-10]
MRIVRVLGFFLFSGINMILGQDASIHFRNKKVSVKDTIQIDSVSINPIDFKVLSKNNTLIDSTSYAVNFENGTLILSSLAKSKNDSISIEYYRYPDFLTKKYFEFDPSIIVEKKGDLQKLYSLSKPKNKTEFKPFDGLTTNGSISRGVTVGSNQSTVLNSELDLQISGKISDKVSLRASIQDANVPVQQNGYSQNLDEFDQVFIELYSKNWNIRAGDVQLQNSTSYFNRFTKNVQGISLNGTLNHMNSKTDLFAAGALVRGVFTRSQFTGQEGNQGPYKLTGSNGELFILIVSGSERVYVNGLLLERGENKDYIIDYNAGELRFNPTYPITSDMRISVEYQTTERNYSRIIAYGGGGHQGEKLKIGAFVYSENDAKNQPLQQNLSDPQKEILSNAGDDPTQMISPSAVPDTFSENKILYRRDIVDGQEIFVFSSNPQDELFNVRFTLVGDNQGDYIVGDVNVISRIFEYVAPVNGVPQGNFAPVIQLQAPTKLQTAVVQGSYTPNEKTTANFELSGSKNDLNLFSDLDDDDNDGVAARIQFTQRVFAKDSSWSMNALASADYVQEQFKSIERIYNVEFTRDWNLNDPLGDQQFLSTGLELFHPKKGFARYSFQHLNFSENYNGNRHNLNSALAFKRFRLSLNSSLLNSKNAALDSRFFRMYGGLAYSFPKNWIGSKIAVEENKEINLTDQTFTLNTQRFKSYELYTGVGDSTKIYAEIGYRYRINDSVRSNKLDEISISNTYYLKSNLLNTSSTQLSLFVNYRTLDNKDENQEDEQSLNSRLLYNQRFFGNKINWNTVFETNSGTLPQQEFTYVEVDPGQGTFTWNDYNDNGIQELDEFEVAQFTDEANYLRVLLPNQVFLKTHQNRLSQIVTLNPSSWSGSDNKTKKLLSHFYNQTSYIIDRKNRRENNSFDLNPFGESDNELALNLSFRNTLFYNRGKQRYTTSYTYLSSKNTNLLVTGLQENKLKNHQLNFVHKIANTWLLDIKNELVETESTSENFANRNYLLEGYRVAPKLSYLLSDQVQFSIFYLLNDQDNTMGVESLSQQKLGASFMYTNKQQVAITGEFNYFNNDFTGNSFSPVGYQLLNGLQPGDNYTWSLLAQKKLTKFLDLNVSYSGRKSEISETIHTGSIQLRAYF